MRVRRLDFTDAVQKLMGAPSLVSSANDKRYIFAIECSNPADENAAIGGTIARILSVVVRALKQSHVARQTSTFASTP